MTVTVFEESKSFQAKLPAAARLSVLAAFPASATPASVEMSGGVTVPEGLLGRFAPSSIQLSPPLFCAIACWSCRWVSEMSSVMAPAAFSSMKLVASGCLSPVCAEETWPDTPIALTLRVDSAVRSITSAAVIWPRALK